MFVIVVVNMPVDGTFHYHIPAELAGRLQVGHLIEVPFGRQKAQGIVLGFDRRAPVEQTRPFSNLIDREPVVSKRQLELARWLSGTYLAPLSDCVRLFIPPGLSKHVEAVPGIFLLLFPGGYIVVPDRLPCPGNHQWN